MKKRMLRWLGMLFVRAGLWCHARTVLLTPVHPERPAAPSRPPVVTDCDTPIDFTWQPAEYQHMAHGCLSLLAPMRWPRRATC